MELKEQEKFLEIKKEVIKMIENKKEKLKENNIKEYLCSFKSYSQIQKESNLFSNSTMVTFSWLSKYLSKESIEECK
ncbi:MAG: hypothetical protein HXM16_08565, partial [Fusobacterium periodonticum]|nr:hypothetical protein [Fusobacterium periodonticum]